MIFRAAPIFKTRFRPFEVALLFLYLGEIARRENSPYLSAFLNRVSMVVLYNDMDQNMNALVKEHALEQAEAIPADVRKNTDPYFERDLL
jgi:hypothetical protein